VNTRIRTIFLAGSAVLLLLQLAPAQMGMGPAPFSADMQMSSGRNAGGAQEMNGKIYFGNQHMRMDMQGGPHGQSIVITDFKTKTTDILMPQNQMYMEYRADQMPGRRPQAWSDVKPLRDPSNPCADEEGTTCKKVGVEQVNGRTCDHWQVTNKNGKVSDVWIDQKLHFPIKTVSPDSTWELTNIKEGEPDASLFQIPAGYHKMDMGNMMHGMPPGGPPER